jgi:hypothetical protein
MRSSALGLLAVLPLGAAAGAVTPPCEHVYRAQAHIPITCMTLISDGWYLTPGLVRKNADGIVAPVSMTDPQILKASMTANQAIAISGDATQADVSSVRGQYADMAPQRSFVSYGGLEKRISLKAWRGQRLQLTVRLKDEDAAHAYVSARIAKANGAAIRTAARVNRPGGAWQVQSFVLDVPGDATFLALNVGLTGKGTAWLDGVSLAAVSKTVPVAWSERLSPNFGSGGDYYNSSTAPPVPGPVRHDEVGAG